MNNLHISLTEFRNESRVIKETASIVMNNIAENVYIAALHSGELKEQENIASNVELKRFKLNSRKIGKNLPAQLLKYLEFVFANYRVSLTYSVSLY